MGETLRFWLCVAFVSLAAGPARLAAQDEAAKRFDEVIAVLDKGGDTYVYLSSKELATKLRERYPLFAMLLEADAATKGDAKLAETRAGLQAIEKLVTQSGLQEISALGISSVRVDEELYRLRAMVHHGAGGGKGKVWQLLAARQHPLEGFDLLPDTTGAAVLGDLDLAIAWDWLAATVRTVGDPNAVQNFENALATFKAQGIDLEALIRSTDGQVGVAITLDDKQMVNFPIEGRNVAIPEPAALVFVKVKDDRILQTLKTLWTKQQVPYRTRALGDGVDLYSFPAPMAQALPFTFLPSLCLSKNWLLVGSNASVITQALDVRDGKTKGLTANPEYARLSQDLPREGNHFLWLSPKVGRYAADVLRAGLAKDNPPERVEQLLELSEQARNPLCFCGVTARRDNGVLLTVNSNVQLSNAVLAGAITAPIALGVYIANNRNRPAANAPAGTDREQQESLRQLQQIGLGLMLYAEEHNGKFPAADGADGLDELVKAKTLTAGEVFLSPYARNRQPEAQLRNLTEDKLSYVYFGGFAGDDAQPASVPLCFEKPGVNPTGVTVLFVDGHVEVFPGQFGSCAAVVGVLKEKLKIPEDRYAKLLSKAKAADAKLGR